MGHKILNNKNYNKIRKFFAAIFYVGLASSVAYLPITTTINTANAATKTSKKHKAIIGVPLAALNVNAPSYYTVQDGDNIDTIKQIFLKNNKVPINLLFGISNANAKKVRIGVIAGQTWYLVKLGKKAYLTANQINSKNKVVYLKPKIRMAGVESVQKYQIPSAILNSFVTKNRIIDAQELIKLPRIIAGENKNSQFFAMTDNIFAQKPEKTPITAQNLHSFRIIAPVYDSENNFQDTKGGKPKPVAYEIQNTGNLYQLSKHENGVSRFAIKESVQEVAIGDYLLPAQIFDGNLAITSVKQQVNAKIIKLYNRQIYSAKGDILLINKGFNHGLEPGNILHIKSKPRLVPTNPDNTKSINSLYETLKNQTEFTKLPSTNKGHAIVFQVSPFVSYAYVNYSSDIIEVSDELTDNE